MMNAPLDIVLRDLRARLEARYGPRLAKLVLFGSRARGDADPESDIDVMVVLRGAGNDGAEQPGYIDIAAELSLEFDAVIMPIVVDEETYQRSGLPLYRNVRREGVAV